MNPMDNFNEADHPRDTTFHKGRFVGKPDNLPEAAFTSVSAAAPSFETLEQYLELESAARNPDTSTGELHRILDQSGNPELVHALIIHRNADAALIDRATQSSNRWLRFTAVAVPATAPETLHRIRDEAVAAREQAVEAIGNTGDHAAAAEHRWTIGNSLSVETDVRTRIARDAVTTR